MLTAVLLLIAKNWKQFKCPSTGKWINYPWYIQKIDYFSIIQSNELLITSTRKNLNGIMLSERCQSQQITDYPIPLKQHSSEDKTRGTKNGSRSRGNRKRRLKR